MRRLLVLMLSILAGPGCGGGGGGGGGSPVGPTDWTQPHLRPTRVKALEVPSAAARAADVAPAPVPVDTSAPLTVGSYRACAVTAAGALMCWGDDAEPETVSQLSAVTAAAAGAAHRCALANARVWCWDYDWYGQTGPADPAEGPYWPESTTLVPVPVAELDGGGVVALTAGLEHTCALLGGGTARCWGWWKGYDGKNDVIDPHPLDTGLTDISRIRAGGYHTCAISTTGTLRCWGVNTHGELGDGTTGEALTPVAPTGLAGVAVADVALGGTGHICVLTAGGSVKCSGANEHGELGDGTTEERHGFVDVVGLAGVSAISAGDAFTCAALGAGGIRCWGWNGSGQLGNGSADADVTLPSVHASPEAVVDLGDAPVASLASGGFWTCATVTGARAGVWCWGMSSAARHLPDPIAPAATDLHRLAVDGARIVDTTDGQAVRLRGTAITVNAWDWSPTQPTEPSTTRFTEADIERIRSWGANAVTIYLDWQWFDSYGYGGWQWMDQVLDWCRKHDVYAIPSLVVYPYSGPRGGPTFWPSNERRAQLRAFWAAFALRYAGRPEIAGLDVTNEPEGNNGDLAAVAAYQAELVDAVRRYDPDMVVFIEPYYGSPWSLTTVDRPNLVYDPHFYEPFHFTGSGMPWIAGNNVPRGVTYPGEMVMSVALPGTDAPATVATADSGGLWQTLEVAATVPTGFDSAFPEVFSGNSPTGTIWFDALEYSLDGAPWTPVVNGSFEDPAEYTAFDRLTWSYRADANHWSAVTCPQSGVCASIPDLPPDQGTIDRVTDVAASGSASARIAACPWFCFYSTQNWIGTAAAIPVSPGSTLRLRGKARWTQIAPTQAGIRLRWGSATRETWDTARLRKSLDDAIGAFAATNGVPIYVGEFTPSLLTPHDATVRYVGDLLDWVDEKGFGWAYYEYRNTMPLPQRSMGIYACPDGTPTGQCDEATYVLDVLRAHLP